MAVWWNSKWSNQQRGTASIARKWESRKRS